MKKVLFIIPGQLGSGEIVNAIIVAEQLREKGVECTFVASPYAENFVKNKGFDYFVFENDKRKNIHHIKEMIKKGIDVTVTADYYLFFPSASPVSARCTAPTWPAPPGSSGCAV